MREGVKQDLKLRVKHRVKFLIPQTVFWHVGA